VSTVVTSYLTVDGEILAESAGGVSRDYVSDPLGSVVALLDSTQSETDTVSYWPYGEELSSSGTSQSPFRYVGSLGYHSDLRSRRTYVRARSYAPPTGRWLSRDPLWPEESAYCYSPAIIDPSGLGGSPCTDLLKPGNKANKNLLDCLYKAGDDTKKIKKCIRDFAGGMTDNACDYAGCEGGSRIEGGNPGTNPECGKDDYPKCYQKYIADLCKCVVNARWWKPVANYKCWLQAYADLHTCVENTDPYDHS
jgi:RHS repeat-associated protein